ncbi:MAG TPA: hypothetical protein VH089_09505 [Streptosporangiaceae bacterium]|nr:hypothetical protein [Streptosporangiaceae bacterium]
MGAWPDQITIPDQLPLAMLTLAADGSVVAANGAWTAQHDTAETLITGARMTARGGRPGG